MNEKPDEKEKNETNETAQGESAKIKTELDEKIKLIEENIKLLEEKNRMLEEKNKLENEYQKQLLYLRADYENLKKLAAREKAEYIKSTNEDLVKKLLPVLDSFECALKIEEIRENKKIKEGIEMLYRQLYEILEKEGLKPVVAVGEKLDPFKHEALTQVQNSEVEEDIVLEEFQKGYTFNSKVIRTSKVKVSKR